MNNPLISEVILVWCEVSFANFNKPNFVGIITSETERLIGQTFRHILGCENMLNLIADTMNILS